MTTMRATNPNPRPPGLSEPDREAALRRMDVVANLLDAAFVVPGTSQRFGIDAIIGLVPGLGDVISTLLSTYVIVEAQRLGVSRWAMARMLANLAIHATVGVIPVLGDGFDAWFQVNRRNLRIARRELGR